MNRSRLSCLLVTAAMFLAGGCDDKAVGMEHDAAVLITGTPQWAMFGSTPQRNGRSAFEGPRSGSYHFVALAEEGEGQNYVLVQSVGPTGVVYAVVRPPRSNGHLVALQPDGTEDWRYPATGAIPIFGSALHPEGTLSIAALHAEYWEGLPLAESELFLSLGTDGAIRWTWQPDQTFGVVPTDILHSPVYDGSGTLYVVMALIPPHSDYRQRHLVSFSSAGDFLWQFDRDIGQFSVQPAVGPDGTLYVLVDGHGNQVDVDEGLYALGPDGAQRWFVPWWQIPKTNTLAVGDDGTVYVGGKMSRALTVTAVGSDGEPRWSYQPAGDRYVMVETTIAISAAGTIYFGATPRGVYDEPGGAVFAVSPDGELVWSVEIERTPCGGLAVDNTGAVYTMTRNLGITPTILGFDRDGAALIAVELEESDRGYCDHTGDQFFLSSVVLADGRVYAGLPYGKLHVIE